MKNYSTVILADSPAAYWRLGESSGTAAADASGNGNAATYTAAYTLGVAGAIDDGDGNTAVTFTTGYVERAFVSLANVTLEAWVKLAAAPGDYLTIVGNGDVSSYSLTIEQTTGKPYIQTHTDSGHPSCSGPVNVCDGAWHHLAGVATAGGSMTMYVDGVPVNTSSGNGNLVTSTANPTSIGKWSNGATSTAHSQDETAIYNAVLTGTRIRAHYLAGILPDTTDVRTGTTYGGASQTGAAAIPARADVRSGTAVGATTGTLAVPAAADVRLGTAVDATTGTAAIPVASDVRQGTPTGSTIGTMEPPPMKQAFDSGVVALTAGAANFVSVYELVLTAGASSVSFEVNNAADAVPVDVELWGRAAAGSAPFRVMHAGTAQTYDSGETAPAAGANSYVANKLPPLYSLLFYLRTQGGTGSQNVQVRGTTAP